LVVVDGILEELSFSSDSSQIFFDGVSLSESCLLKAGSVSLGLELLNILVELIESSGLFVNDLLCCFVLF
jgi:hypothetical protein